METWIFIVSAAMAGLTQGVTGFGAGIVMMMVLPWFFPIAQSAGISTASIIPLCVMMVLRYRRSIHVRKALLTAAFCIMISSLSILFSASINQLLMKRIFGGFLILLSAYYLFLQGHRKNTGLSGPAKIACMAVSALCEGLFGIGGPLMVLYFLSDSGSNEEYLGSIQLYFLIMDAYNTIFRFSTGVLQTEHLMMIIPGMAGIILGGFAAAKILTRIRPDKLKTLIYVMIGISGIINLI